MKHTDASPSPGAAPARLARRAAAVSLALVASSASCEGDVQRFDMLFDPCRPVVLDAQPDATAEEVAIIEEAVAMWAEVAAIEATTEDVAGARRLAVSFPEDIWYYGRFDDAAGGLEVASWIEDPRGMAIVLAHELGHAYNLYHVDPGERASVMNDGNRDVAPTPGDGEALAGLWGECAAP